MMKKRQKSLTAPYAAMQMLFWSTLCTGQTYAMPFLCDMGLTDAQVGLILAIANAVVLPASLGLNKLYMYIARGSLRRLIWLSDFGLMAALLIMYSSYGHGMIYVTSAFSLVMIFMVNLNGLINAMGMIYGPLGFRLNFAIGRGMGSLGYALTALCMGRLLLYIEAQWVMLLSVVTAGLMLVLLVVFPQASDHKSAVSAQEPQMAGEDITFWKPSFVSFLLACTLLLVSSNTFTNFLLQITVAVGENKEAMGKFAALAAVLEVPAILSITALKRHFSDKQLLRFCSVMFIVKYGVIFLMQNSAGMYLAQIMQPLSYAFLLPVSTYYVDAVLSPKYAAMGQILLVGTNTAASVAGSLTGGMILQRGSVHHLLGMIVAFAVAGCIVLWRTTGNVCAKSRQA